jgi:hypothetical protein
MHLVGEAVSCAGYGVCRKDARGQFDDRTVEDDQQELEARVLAAQLPPGVEDKEVFKFPFIKVGPRWDSISRPVEFLSYSLSCELDNIGPFVDKTVAFLSPSIPQRLH